VSIERPPTPPAYAPDPAERAGARPVPPRLEKLSRRHPLVIAAVIVAVTVTLLTAALTIIAFAADQWWVFDIVTSYRPQFVLVLTIAVVALAVLRCWRTLLVAVLALGLNAVVVAPVFTGHQASAAPGSPSLTIAHLNLQSRIGDLPGIHRWLETRPADIIVFLHTAEPTANSLVKGVGPYRMIYPVFAGLNHNDRAVYRPDPEVIVMSDQRDAIATAPTFPGLPAAAVTIVAHLGSHQIALLACHTLSPGTGARHSVRNAELDAVGAWLKSTPQPAVAFGDFNVTYFSPTFQHLLHVSHATSSQLGFGIQATWPHQFRLAGIAIDQSVYVGGITAVARFRGPSLGSEHRALIVRYELAAP
jgi:endonuclease/exonuclease/phosphatase (EEP) superfamily protein YafD